MTFGHLALMSAIHQQDAPYAAQLAVLTTGVAVIGSNSLALSPILGDVAQALGTGPAMVAHAITAYGGATALSALLLAPRIDVLGARRTLQLGLAFLASATLASALSPHGLALALAQALAGLGAGVALPATYAMATLVAAPQTQSRTLGWVLGGWSISLVAGVPGAALLADLGGGRLPFAVLTGLALLAAGGTVLLPKSVRPVAEGRLGLLALLRHRDVPRLLLIVSPSWRPSTASMPSLASMCAPRSICPTAVPG
jgi:predicted MFS family arabinose efflux permease